MPRVVIRPDPGRYTLRDEELLAFARALEEQGFEVTVEFPRPRRGGALQAAYDVAAYLFENADNIVAAALIARCAARTLGGHRTDGHEHRRRAAIYDQDGAIIREIVLERTDDE